MLFVNASAQTVCFKAIILLKIKCFLSTQALKLFFLIYTALKSAFYASTNIFAHVSQGINFLKCIFYVIFHINDTSWFLAINFVLEYSPKKKSIGVKFVVRAGQSIGPLCPIYFNRNVSSRCSWTPLKYCEGAPSC